MKSQEVRDKEDSTREIAPLKRAVDAIDVDTDNKTIQMVFEEMISKIILKNKS